MDKIILFDMDGTLIDSTEAIYESFVEVFKKHDLPIATRAEVSRLIGYPLDEMFRMLGIDESKIESCFNAYREHYITICDEKTTLLPNAMKSIKLAAEFTYLGVVTTKASKSSRELLRHFGLERYFHTIIGKEDVIYPKPNPEPILKAIARIEAILDREIERRNIFMIGDTTLDLRSAIDSSINGIGVLCGYGDEASLKNFSQNIFPSTLEAVEFIENLKEPKLDS